MCPSFCSSVLLSVCLSLRLSACPPVCLSVRLSLVQSEITNDPDVQSWPNFRGQRNSMQVIYGLVVRMPGPLGSGLDPKRAFSANLSSLGFGAGGSFIPFRKREDKAKKILGAEFCFLAHGL